MTVRDRPPLTNHTNLDDLSGRIAHERAMAAANRLKPYSSQVMPQLRQMSLAQIGALLDRLSTASLRYLLIESFGVPTSYRAADWLAQASAPTIGRLMGELATDVDGLRRARELLCYLSPPLVIPALLGYCPLTALEALLAGASVDLWRHLLIGLDPAETGALLNRIQMDDVAVYRVARVLRSQSPESRPELAEGSVEEQSLSWQTELLTSVAPDVAARLRAALAWSETGELVDVSLRRALVWLEERPLAVAQRALQGLAPDRRNHLLAHLPATTRAQLSPTALSVSPARGPPVPYRWREVQERTLDAGLCWTQMEGELQTEAGPWPLRADLLAMDMARIRLVSQRALPEVDLIPMTEAVTLLGHRSRADDRPPPTLFDRLGLVRLSEAVTAAGAIAGINGGFYFDYGHYLDVQDLELDPTVFPGLAFGELAGWFVSGGVTDVPPIFNRGALLVTGDGQIHIRRVFVRQLSLDDRWLSWDAVNVRCSADQIVLYNAVVGPRTPVDPQVVDLAIARNRVQVIRPGGGQVVPMWGVVLSIPRSQAAEAVGGVHVGDPAIFEADLSASLGTVVEAMACGPQLVRDGQVELDFDLEDFGEKDTTVLPLSLTRAANAFRAARSFVMLRAGELVLGTVSGTALGTGRPPVSAGMTLGELALLSADLGAEQALGLDGGGSSTLVALDGGVPRVLNVPTGGADVPFGRERYINTYWLVFDRVTLHSCKRDKVRHTSES